LPILTLQPDSASGKDTRIRNFADANLGGSDIFIVDMEAGDLHRGLLEFAFTKPPANAVINSATLTLTTRNGVGGNASNTLYMKAYRVTQSWDETTATWANQPSFDSASSSPEVAIGAITTLTVTNFDVKSIVQSWINSGTPNYGFMLKGRETVDNSSKTFDSSDYITAANRPKLVIDYTVPDTTLPTGSRADAQVRYLNAGSNKTATFTVNAADNVGVTSVKFPTWGDSGGQNDIVWYEGTNNGNGTWSRTIDFNTHDGGIDQHYNIHVYAYDAAGNNAMIATYDVYVDTVAPTYSNATVGTTPASVASGGTKNVSVDIADNLTGAKIQDAYYRKPDGTWVQYVNAVTSSGATRTMPVPITAEGTYLVHFYIMDNAGNNGAWPLELSFLIDRTAPTIGSIDATQYSNFTSGTRRVNIYNVSDTYLNRVGVYYRKSINNGSTWGGWLGEYNAVQSGTTWYYDVPLSAGDGVYEVHFRAYDNAGNISNSGNPTVSFVYTDTVTPTAPTQTNGTLYATSNGVSWSTFSDGVATSGLLSTTLYLQSWNGSTWSNVATYPKSVTGITHGFTGLTPETQYRWGVTYTDNSGNVSTLNYTTFTTNTYPVTTIVNLTSNGYLFDKTPKIKFTVTDANDATLTNFEVQFATNSAFTQNVGVMMSSSNPTYFSATSASSGSTIYCTSPAEAPVTGLWYARARAYDGKDWGAFSTVSFTINTVSWITTIASDDSTISKRTIDEIRTKVNSVRQARGLAVANWTDATIIDWNGGTPTLIRTTHLIELRQAIVDIYTTLSLTPPIWTDNIIDTYVNRKGTHWIELRDALINC
jgi:hypothetical protein